MSIDLLIWMFFEASITLELSMFLVMLMFLDASTLLVMVIGL